MNFEQYEAACERIRKENSDCLKLFHEALTERKLSEKTIKRHLSNVDFYINDYLLHEDANPMEKGAGMIDSFLGSFFIRKCAWSTPGTIKTMAASIRKFYKCMLTNGRISPMDYALLCDDIKFGMEEWQDYCEDYNNGDTYW